MIQLAPTLRLSKTERDGNRCAEFGKDNTKLDIHNTISIRNGGKHLLENLRQYRIKFIRDSFRR